MVAELTEPGLPVISAQDLAKTYARDVRAVRGISFDVPAGETFGLLGPNGAGKSTTIGMLNSTVRPTSGRAFLGGLDVARNPIATRAMSSVVFQDTVVDRTLTGRRNLGIHLKLWGRDTPSGRAAVAELTDAVDIDGVLDRPVETYSGGQRRRLEIVRALVSSPRVLFLDEPTVGLDTRIRHELFDVIATLRMRTGVTIILTTHYLDEAERLCDRLAIVDQGVIVACDTPANLTAALGREVLELRVDDAVRAVRALADTGVRPPDVLVVGTTVTVCLKAIEADRVFDAFDVAGVSVHASTRRPPSLDDVYLQLTGDRFAPAGN
ncbi:MAG TPA: ABC transporter ATP-binding protein [Jatrophihabitantaceae bacterium]|nr:ABC transporter ATP-binding protein [Jatrophihabitantaceae bacterium]